MIAYEGVIDLLEIGIPLGMTIRRITNRFGVCGDGCVVQRVGQTFDILSFGFIELGCMTEPEKFLEILDADRRKQLTDTLIAKRAGVLKIDLLPPFAISGHTAALVQFVNGEMKQFTCLCVTEDIRQ